MTPSFAGALVAGAGLGLGLWALVSVLPGLRSRSLVERVAPYLLDVSDVARQMRRRRPVEPTTLFLWLVAPTWGRARRLLASVLGGDEVLSRRLRQSGQSPSVTRFRARQLAWVSSSAGTGLMIAVLLGGVGGLPPLAALGLGAVITITGALLPEHVLARRARARLARITAELPTMLEFLTLALSAGETVRDALRRVGRVGTGELAREFADVMAEVDLGVPLTHALSDCAAALEVPALTRAIEQLVSAIDRGNPLVDVLRAQAQDCRDEAKRALLESSGRKEIAMLVPLVFLILPVTIVFAIFPATLVLELGF